MTTKYEQRQRIKRDSNVSELLDVFSKLNIPDAFEFVIKDGLLVLKSIRNEFKELEITFPQSLLRINTEFPIFVFCTAHINPMDKVQFLNHWELLYMMLEDRLPALAKHNSVYGGLIQQDISFVNQYVMYIKGNSFNTRVKNDNTVVLLDVYDKFGYIYKNHSPLGDWLPKTLPSERVIREQLAIMNIAPGSETMLSKSAKVVLDFPSRGEYKAPGFKIIRSGNKTLGFKSIFPPKQNVPARLKTHLHGEAYSFKRPDSAIFLQDAIFKDNQSWVTKDDTLRDMIVVFEEMDTESKRFVGGEIEVSKSFGSEIVFTKKHRELQLDQVFLEEGRIYTSKSGRIKIGMYEEEVRTIDQVDKIEVLSIKETGFAKGYRIEFIAYSRATNSRITSNTGFKGVTKVMANMGKIHSGDIKINVTARCSMNSMKGKMNTIRLAQAALAYKLGTYIPKNGYLLDSLDEEEINAAVDSLPEFTYICKDNVIKNAKVGLIQASVTELASMYARIKNQTLSFNAVKYMSQSSDGELANHILENYIDEDQKSMVMELGKIIQDVNGYFADKDDLPIYRLDKLSEVFDEEDIIFSKKTIFPLNSKLLDEEFNQGFYLNCKPVSNKYIRIPPATFINRLCDQLPNGEYIYPDILINISKMIAHCIGDEKHYHYVTHGKNEVNSTRTTARDAYLRGCRNMLYSEESYGNRMINTLLTPQLPGIGLKQVLDQYVPENTVVIFDNSIYSKLYNIAYGKEVDFGNPLKSFAVRNPFLWRTQLTIVNIWNTEDFAAHLDKNHNIKIEDYIVPELNRYCVLVGESILRQHHSDNDGDLLSLSLPFGEEGQTLLSEFKLHGVTKDQLDWDNEYIQGELSSNEDFDWGKKYKLYTIYNNKQSPRDHEYYNGYLVNASTAKSAVGE